MKSSDSHFSSVVTDSVWSRWTNVDRQCVHIAMLSPELGIELIPGVLGLQLNIPNLCDDTGKGAAARRVVDHHLAVSEGFEDFPRRQPHGPEAHEEVVKFSSNDEWRSSCMQIDVPFVTSWARGKSESTQCYKGSCVLLATVEIMLMNTLREEESVGGR